MQIDTSHWSDDQLMAELGAALDAMDPVPSAVTEFAKAAFAWRTIDAELAELVFDSEGEQLAGVRSGAGARQMTFRAPGVEIEVVVMSEGARRLVGQLVPPQAATVELRYRDEVRSAKCDSLGRFTFQDVPVGPISIRCSIDDGDGNMVVQTDWMIV